MTRPLPTTTIPAGQRLYHVSRIAYAGTALHFGCGDNRYDDRAGRFKVLYVGWDLPTALMESMFHQHEWTIDKRHVASAALADRLVREVAVLDRLTLVDLNTPGLMAARFGLNLHQLTSRDYTHTQQIAALAHEQSGVDGILYPSRNNYPGSCIALFDRCRARVGLITDIALERHRHWPDFAQQYGVTILPE